ncbi:MAG: HAD family hydrolase [Dehalococcoidia bacterium]|jgi:putative hydrolase of the HAD superfamily
MIKAVFFDFYNTLVNYDPPREVAHANFLGTLGISITPEQLLRPIMLGDDFLSKEHSRHSLGKRSREEVAAVYGRYHGMVLEAAGIEPRPELIAKILQYWMNVDTRLALFEDVAPALDELKGRGLTLGLISNVDRDIGAIYEALGLPGWLGIKVTSQDAGFNKPHPEIFRAALKQADVEPSQAVYVGDQYEIDVVGSNAVGMRGILIDRHDFFGDSGADIRIRSFGEIKEHLD